MSAHFTDSPSALTTTGTSTFGRPTAASEPLFRTNPAVPYDEALSQASELMDCINRLTLNAGAEGDSGAVVWAAHYLGQQVKAIIDDVAAGFRR